MVQPVRILSVIAVALLVYGCEGPDGPDGIDGRAYFSVANTDGRTYSYSDDNYMFPTSFSWSTYYEVDAGTYSYVYESRTYYSTYYTYVIWRGSYAIWIHPGEEGGKGTPFWKSGAPGEDGVDSYLTLKCYYAGPGWNRLNKVGEMAPDIIGPTTGVLEEQGANHRIRIEYSLVESGKKPLR